MHSIGWLAVKDQSLWKKPTSVSSPSDRKWSPFNKLLELYAAGQEKQPESLDLSDAEKVIEWA